MILYHYTNNAGLVGILRNGTLWFSDIRFLNDARELECGYDVLAKIIQNIANSHRNEWINSGCQERHFDTLVKNILAKIRYNGIDKSEPSIQMPFVFSMTEKRDSLSQWRAYGNGEYCIGFDSTKLLEKLPEAELVEVVYATEGLDNVHNVPVHEERINRFFAGHIQHIHKETGGIDEEVLREGAYELFHPTQLYDGKFLTKYKDYAFHEEKERRLVIYMCADDKRIFFDNKGLYPRPRAKIKMFENGDEACEIITQVTTGPEVDKELSETALSMLFSGIGCRGIEICPSRIPYRSK
jgi:Protein of unknown function (DUF2971)